ncbi:MAG: NAD-dependent epimerase/dehydratase family protein [Nitrosopumilus sp.]|nr:NAD-dependent epimerase/dehydratase family protein [Nitrosopumilus sp.]
MRFAVTGGAGFIGSYISKLLLEKDHDVLVLDNMHTGKKENLHNSNKLEFFQVDVRDYKILENQLHGVDGIFHEAGLTLVPESFEKPDEYHDVNVNGTENIFKISKKLGVKVVYASSSSVYGKTEKIPIKENDPKNPMNPYGKTKVEKDNLAEKFSKEGCSIIGLRYFNVFGKGQTGTYAGVIAKFLESLKNKTAPVIYGDGKQVRDFISVEDVASANLQAMLSDTKYGFFNIGTGVPTTILELAELMIRISNYHIKPIFKEARRGDVKLSQADLVNSQKYLNWHSEIKLEEGLKKLMNEIL